MFLLFSYVESISLGAELAGIRNDRFSVNLASKRLNISHISHKCSAVVFILSLSEFFLFLELDLSIKLIMDYYNPLGGESLR